MSMTSQDAPAPTSSAELRCTASRWTQHAGGARPKSSPLSIDHTSCALPAKLDSRGCTGLFESGEPRHGLRGFLEKRGPANPRSG
jgi:hypothetical protein